jgi:magnesium transporter
MLKIMSLENGKVLETEKSGSIFVYTEPDQHEKDQIELSFDIDMHTISSALDPDEISRFEYNESNVHIIWKYPEAVTTENGKFNFAVSSMGLFFVNNKVVVIRPKEYILLDKRNSPKMINELELFLYIIYNTVHSYMKHLEVIKMIYREIQSKIIEDLGNAHLIQMISLSESLVYYLNAIQSNTVVLQRLKKFLEKNKVDEDLIDLLENIQIDNSQCYQQAETYAQILSGLIDAQASIINNNMNSAIKNLTTINIIFLPLNLLAGIGGMSEYSMMTKYIPWQMSYFLFFVGLIIIGYIMTIFVSKNDKKKNT